MKKILSTMCLLALTASPARAAEIGHYAGGMVNIRDLIVPAPGVYGVLYNYYYKTDRINDSHGHEIDSVTIGRNSPVTLDIEPDIDIYVLAPALIWVTPWEILGARYAALILPTFANASVAAALSTELGGGVEPDTGQFGVGDLYVQPLWLGWTLDHWDFALAYGFYAPTGKYDTGTEELPNGETVRVEDADNIGLGFWTNQFQGAAAWYPWTNKGTAVTLALTYEINSDKKDYDVTAGDNLTLNWGISQFLPLSKDMKWLAEVGPAGYDTWQVSEDSGSDRTNGVLDQVHGVGFQVGVTAVEWLGSLNFHYFYEVESEDRFQGHVVGLSIAKELRTW